MTLEEQEVFYKPGEKVLFVNKEALINSSVDLTPLKKNAYLHRWELTVIRSTIHNGQVYYDLKHPDGTTRYYPFHSITFAMNKDEHFLHNLLK